jgi:hypothetical protein
MEVEECKGLVYKAGINFFRNKNGEYVVHKRLRFMKKLSCSMEGCCGWMEEELSKAWFDYSPDELGVNNIKNGYLYKLTVNVIYSCEIDNNEYVFKFVEIGNPEG